MAGLGRQVGDVGAALDAVLSVKTSAAMVGALRLSCCAAGLERALRTGTGDVALLCEDLLAYGDETLSPTEGIWANRNSPWRPR